MPTAPRHYPPVTERIMPKVAMIGGGQLARMTAQAAIELGQTLRVVSPGPTESAAQITPDVVVGEHTDIEALSLIHISEPTRLSLVSRMPSSA